MMILEEVTFEAYEYYPKDLKPKSVKTIIAICEYCGEFRFFGKHHYHTFCSSCSHLLGEANKGDKNSNYGKSFSKEHKRRLSEAWKSEKHPNIGKCGKDAFGYKGGEKLANARDRSKRKRELGYTLLMSLKEGEVGHHLTNEHVIGISEDVHKKLSGYSRKKHRTLVLQWLKVNDKKKYNLVLCVLAKD